MAAVTASALTCLRRRLAFAGQLRPSADAMGNARAFALDGGGADLDHLFDDTQSTAAEYATVLC